MTETDDGTANEGGQDQRNQKGHFALMQHVIQGPPAATVRALLGKQLLKPARTECQAEDKERNKTK
jgi:hypothetical protein